MMTTKEIFELRKQGRKEEAYEAARALYATDKSPYASLAMFWTAVDMLRFLLCKHPSCVPSVASDLWSSAAERRVGEDRLDEAEKIFLALERLLPTVPDKDGRVNDVFVNCRDLLAKKSTQQPQQKGKPEHLQMGSWGEELAADYLREKGYVILERDWHSGHRDIDIIAQQDSCIVFVEVKTRRSADFGSPVQAVDYHKQQNLLRAINHYIHYRHLDNPWRFDVISIVGVPGRHPDIEHIEDFALNQR